MYFYYNTKILLVKWGDTKINCKIGAIIVKLKIGKVGISMEIGRRLSELRKKNGYTQKQLADALNLSQQIVSNIERNTTAPDVKFLHGAADLYKISLDELIGRKTLITEESSYEQQILNVVETMDDTKKELSLRLLNEVAQQRGDKDGK